jgi:hypothetical protein
VYVAFESLADNLAPGDMNDTWDVFVKNLTTGVTTRVSTSSGGGQGNGASEAPALAVAPNGSVYVAFYSRANNLVPGDNNNTWDIFVKNLTTGVTTRVSTASNGTEADGYSEEPAVAVGPNGSVYAGFASFADNLVAGDTNNVEDVFVKNLTTGVTTRVSTASDGSQASSVQTGSIGPALAVRPDGTVLVAFSSYATNLVAGDTNNSEDVFVKDLTSGAITRVSTASDGSQGNGSPFMLFVPALAVGPDGSAYVAFTNDATKLVAGDTNHSADVFVKDLATGATTRVSAANDGTQANSSSGDPALAVGSGGAVYVAFDSAATNLVPGDTNGTSDVFLFSDVTAPVIVNPGPQASSEGDPVTLAISAQDADGSLLRYSATGLPTGLAINAASGVISGTVQAPAAGASPYTVTVSVTDGFHNAASTFLWTVGVSNLPPTARVTGPAVAVPGQELTFALSASDLSASDRAAGFTYTVNWGDNSPMQTIGANPGNGTGVLVTHIFQQLGSLTVTVTAIDQHGAISLAATTAVTVSVVSLQVDPVDPAKTALVVGTSPGTVNRLRIQAVGGGIALVNNDVTLGTFQPTGHIILYANGANDNVEALKNVTLDCMFFGGTGNDWLTGGSGHNIIVGGSGTNTIFGRDAGDLLVSGKGQSTIVGRGGGDLDIAGWTSFDHNLQALAAILAEWISTDDLPTRVADLTGQGNGQGQGLNGEFFLHVGKTVFRNLLPDSVTAGAGQDLIIASGGRAGTRDTITGLEPKDLAINI